MGHVPEGEGVAPGRECQVEALVTFAAAAYNLVRWPKPTAMLAT